MSHLGLALEDRRFDLIVVFHFFILPVSLDKFGHSFLIHLLFSLKDGFDFMNTVREVLDEFFSVDHNYFARSAMAADFEVRNDFSHLFGFILRSLRFEKVYKRVFIMMVLVEQLFHTLLLFLVNFSVVISADNSLFIEGMAWVKNCEWNSLENARLDFNAFLKENLTFVDQI